MYRYPQEIGRILMVKHKREPNNRKNPLALVIMKYNICVFYKICNKLHIFTCIYIFLEKKGLITTAGKNILMMELIKQDMK